MADHVILVGATTNIPSGVDIPPDPMEVDFGGIPPDSLISPVVPSAQGGNIVHGEVIKLVDLPSLSKSRLLCLVPATPVDY